MVLTRFDEAYQALMVARDYDEVKQIRDKMEALRVYLKQQGESLEMQNACAEIKIRAERRAGEILRDMPKAAGGQPYQERNSTGNTVLPVENEAPTLADLGLSKMQSSRFQSIASIPEPKFEQYIAETKAGQEELTTAGLLRVKASESATAHNNHAADDDPGYDGDEWYTPLEVIEAARKVMGSIDLDPATCQESQDHIQAETHFTKEDDGLSRQWSGNVWLNPPYSLGLVDRFVDKTIAEYDAGNINQAIVLVNNSSDTGWFHKLLSAYPACFTRGRLKFWRPHRNFATRQGQAIFYIGDSPDKFAAVFSQFGIVVKQYDD